MKVSAIVLAAGLSRRMTAPGHPGRNKLLLPYNGRPLLERVLKLAASFDFFQHILVTTPEIAAKVDLPTAFQVVCNPTPQKGQSASLRLGTQAASGEGYLFFVGDQPLLDRQTVENVLAAAGPENIVYPVCDGRPGNPVFFGSAYREELLAVQGDAGGRALREKYPQCCVPVQASSALALLDIDTYEDYLRLDKDKPPA